MAIQLEFEQRLREIGEWLKINGEAIYGTTYGPLQNLPYGRTTQKGSAVYLHIFDWPHGPLEVNGIESHVVSATLLAGRKALQVRQDGTRITIEVPAKAPDANATVIALETK